MLAVSVLSASAFADDAARHADTRKLLELAGTRQLVDQMLPRLITQFRQMMPDVPADFWTDFQKECDPQAFIDMVVPIYEEHFSDDEIKQLIAFYESPIGKKLSATQPLLVQESMTAGQAWGRQIGEKVIQQLKAKGIKPHSA